MIEITSPRIISKLRFLKNPDKTELLSDHGLHSGQNHFLYQLNYIMYVIFKTIINIGKMDQKIFFWENGF